MNSSRIAPRQNEITLAGPLLDDHGVLPQMGWARQPPLDTNLEKARTRISIKKWDYYCLFLPSHVIAFALADLTYAGSAFCWSKASGLLQSGEPLGINIGTGFAEEQFARW